MKTESGDYKGPLMMLLASICFSMGGLLCKMIPWSALAINGVRNLIGSAVIGIYLLMTHHRVKMNGTVVFGAVSMCGVTTLFAFANKMTTAGNAIVLEYTAPVWIILMMFLFFGQKPRKADLIALAAVMFGVLCFFIDSLSVGDLAGNVVALLSGIFFAGLFILNSFKNGDAISSLFFGQLITGIIMTPFVFRETDFSPKTLLAIFILGAVQVGLAYVFFYQGTKRTNPLTASLISGLEPVLNPILVAVFWGELLTPLSVFGAVVVILSIFIYNIWLGRKHPADQGMEKAC